MKKLLALSLTAVTFIGFSGQAHAVNLLIAVGAPQFQVVLSEAQSFETACLYNIEEFDVSSFPVVIQ